MPKTRLKANAPIEVYDPETRFRDPSKVFDALIDALKSGDGDAFKEILAAYLDVANKDKFSRVSGISRRTLFRMLSPSGNPTLDNITKVVSALKRVA
jgi:probable addiction module antidote protein